MEHWIVWSGHTRVGKIADLGTNRTQVLGSGPVYTTPNIFLGCTGVKSVASQNLVKKYSGTMYYHSHQWFMKIGVYLGVRTCELFLCFIAIVGVRVYYVDFFVFRHWWVSQVLQWGRAENWAAYINWLATWFTRDRSELSRVLTDRLQLHL